MRLPFLISFGLALSCNGYTQAFNLRYDFGELGSPEIAWSVDPLSNDRFAIFGSYWDGSKYNSYVTQISNEGLILNEAVLEIDTLSIVSGLHNSTDKISDEEGFIQGTAYSNSQGLDMFLVRYDSSGDTLWTRIFQNEFGFDEIGYSAIYDEDSFLIVGVGGAENGYARGVVAKTDLEGNTLWKKYYAGYTGPASSTIFSSIDNAFEGGYVVGSGTRSCSTCPFQHHLVRLDEDGNVLWSDILTNTADDGEIQPLHYGDGTYFGFGERCLDEDAYYECKPYLLKYDESGDTLWTKVYGDQWGVRSYFTVGKKLSDGHLFTGGQIENDNYQKGFIMKLDTSGQEIWKRIYVNIEGNECRFNDFTELTTGELVAVGVAWPQVGPPLVGQDTWIVKTDSYGCLIPGCHVSVEELEEERRSFLAGPNPVSTVLNLYLPGEVEHRGQTRFRITDSSGHLIREFSADTGSTTYMLDVSQYTAGIYLVTLLVDQQVIGTERIVVE